MIGHYLDQLDEEAEDRILTTVLEPTHYCELVDGRMTRCLVGAVADFSPNWSSPSGPEWKREWVTRARWQPTVDHSVEFRYDALCWKIGTERANELIRVRVLANKARRQETIQKFLAPREAQNEEISIG